jgi:hypothetical protein
MELLQGIRDACQKYKDKYFDKKNLNKNDDVKELLKKVEMEEKGKAYEANLKGGKFTTLTRSGRDAVKGIEPKHRGFAQQHKLSNAELSAIRIYTAAEFNYINPVLAGNQAWLGAVIKEFQKPDSAGEKPEVTEEHREQVRFEAKQHAEIAEAGLENLPDWKGNVYRGMALTQEELDGMFQQGKTVVYPSFTSTSTKNATAQVFANKNATGGKVGILLEIKAIKGKDLKEISFTPKESEIILSPGSSFTVNEIIPPSKDGDYTVVKMTQTS